MIVFDRTRINFFSKWWKSLDRSVIFFVILMILLGNIFTLMASPIVATRIGANPNIFIIKNLIFSSAGFFLIILFSFFDKEKIIQISFVSFFILTVLLIAVLVFGTENKGAKRWLYFFGFSIQPSELIKPFFIVVTSYLLTEFKKIENINIISALILFLLLSFSLILQPDIGMLILISAIFCIQLFLIMVKIRYFIFLLLGVGIAFFALYFSFPHFQTRIDTYFNSIFLAGEKSYQIQKSLTAFSNGGLLGKGPLEGSIKNYIPDAHTDFIFSVIAEEFGLIVCLFILFVYFYIAIRFILKAIETTNNFSYICITGLSLEFIFQAIINIGVTLNILPTKGMTLPLISYGGSSMIGISITLGILLALSKKTYGTIENNSINDIIISMHKN